MAEAGFGPHVGRLVAYPWEHPAGAVIVAVGRRRRIAGAACCVSFGATGWIGALGVVPRARGRGVGTGLTETSVEWLRARGAETSLLYATDAGRPVYERAGFVAEGRARAWRGVSQPDARDRSLRPLRAGDRGALRALDAGATGEQRAPVIDVIRPLRGLAAIDDDERLGGYMLSSPWSAGPAVVANSEATGLALLAAARGATQGAPILTLPDANRTGVAALEGWGFDAVNHAERMRLGPAPAWRPERIFGMYNLFWG